MRAATRTIAAGAVLAATVLAAPAGAEVPENWSHPEDVSFLHALLVLGGIPLTLFVVIAVLVSVPGWISGAAAAGTTTDIEWFGGPRQGTTDLAEPDDDESKAGGASVRW